MVATTDLLTDFGSRFCIIERLKTLAPKVSPGSSPVSKLIAGGVEPPMSRIARVVGLAVLVLLRGDRE